MLQITFIHDGLQTQYFLLIIIHSKGVPASDRNKGKGTIMFALRMFKENLRTFNTRRTFSSGIKMILIALSIKKLDFLQRIGLKRKAR